MTDTVTSRFINLVDQPPRLNFDQFGQARIPLDPQRGGFVDVTAFRTASLRIGSSRASSFTIVFGKLSGATLAAATDSPIDDQIHTFRVVGPEMSLSLTGGPPGTRERVQIWVFLQS